MRAAPLLGAILAIPACSTPPLTGCEAAIVAFAHPCALPISDDARASLALQAKVTCDAMRAVPGIVALDVSGQACADAMAATSDCALPLQCIGVTGTLPVGAPCAIGAQCASGDCSASPGLLGLGPTPPLACGMCDPTFAGAPCNGTCTYGFACVSGRCVASAGNEGDPCNGGGAPDGCSAPFHCDATQHCVAPGALGATCVVDSDCESPLACDTAGTKACVTAATEGAPCASTPCADGLGCNGITQTCFNPIFVDQGQPCGGSTVMCKRGACAISPGMTGRCPRIVPAGQPCDATGPSQACEETARCLSGTCQLFDPRTCM